METKPIKRNKHIVKLSKDHHVTLLFCWKIRTGVKAEIDPERIKKYIAYFWQHHMQPHFLQEETILFAPVKDEAVQKALDEHAQIEKQIKDLSNDEAITVLQLSVLADSVDNHVRYEERILFPHLEKVLNEQQLESIGNKIAAQENPELTDDFSDTFWLKDKK
ncbi:hypothetical protein BH10BAC3_BH10BAC3_09050 [soil metagenome]